LQDFLKWREGEDGDRRAENDVAPVIQFAVDLWNDPCIGDIGPDQLVALKSALPEIPTPTGFDQNQRSLFQRWSIAKENDYVIVRNGSTIKLQRVSTSTLRKRYRTALNTFWAFLIKNLYVKGPAPDFASKSKLNRPAVERDAFEEEELIKFLSLPLFTGCAGAARIWNPGDYFCQNFFYWAVLIQLLCGLRQGEISQLRCADIAKLYDQWHFRFAKRSLADGEKDEDEDDTKPGGNDAKTKNAFRWVPIHPLLDQLGIIARRDAIVADYIDREIANAGGRGAVSNAQREKFREDAQQCWLFPEWKVYILPSGQIRWSHAVSKSWQYVKTKFGMQRKGLALYSARHTFKGFIDDLPGLSERSRRVVMGHSTATDTPGGYGPKSITEEQAEVILTLSNTLIDRMSALLNSGVNGVREGRLTQIDAWRIDERTTDRTLQEALRKRDEFYL
jgi:integrase